MSALLVALKRLGWPGLSGLVLLGFGLWIEYDCAPAQQAKTAQIEADTRRLRHELMADAARLEAERRAGSAQRTTPDSPQAAWQALWRGLPDGSQRVALQKSVLLSAQERGLVLNNVQYRGQMETWVDKQASQGLWRLRMAMPVEGPYVAVRAWLSSLLQQPALSIDALELQRSDAMSDQVKAQVSVSLWWRQDGGAK